MNQGWVKLYRSGLDNELFKNSTTWHLWTYCLLKATHKPTKVLIGGKSILLQPGQFIFGRKKASEETGLSERKIRTSLEHLKNTQNLTITSTNKYSIITIINWQSYQSDTSKSDQKTDQQPTSNRPATDHIQECKEGKECKEDQEKRRHPVTLEDGKLKNISEEQLQSWGRAYPSVNIKGEILKINSWLKANPKKRYQNYERFIINWLDRSEKDSQTLQPRNTQDATPKTAEERRIEAEDDFKRMLEDIA